MPKYDWSEKTFDRCVRFLEGIAKVTGLTYQQVNVILFCYALPVVLVGLIAAVVILSVGG